MARMGCNGAILVVEGGSDYRFWNARKCLGCELVDGEGKENVVGAIHRLDADNVRGALGVVDEDYDGLMGVRRETENLVSTEVHDMECLLCRSSALDTVLAEFGEGPKIRRFEESEGVDVRTGLLERALVFGRVRWAALRDDLRIDFDAIRVQRFVNCEGWAVDGEGLVRAVVEGNQYCDYETLRRSLDALPMADPWCVAQGHDMVEILKRGLRQVLGTLEVSTGVNDIMRILRVAISSEELEGTHLGSDVRAWERANGYSILPH